MAKDPLRTRFSEMLGIEFPIIAFTHCKDVAVAVINSGGFAVLGEAMHTPDDIAADIQWIRDRIDGKPFGIDLVLPASVPAAASLDQLLEKIPDEQKSFAKHIKETYNVPDPKEEIALHQWGGLNQELGRGHNSTFFSMSGFRLIASGLGSPAFILDAAHERDMLVFGLVGKARQAKRQLEAGVDGIIAQGYDAAGHTGAVGTFSIVPGNRGHRRRHTGHRRRRRHHRHATSPPRSAWALRASGRGRYGWRRESRTST